MNLLRALNVIKVAAEKKAFHIFSVPVLNFITIGQQLTIKSARFWQLCFISIWQLTGLFIVKLLSQTGLVLELVPLQLCCSQGGKSRI